MASDPYERLRGKFIVFDGIDGAGKGAQFDLMEQALAQRGIGYLRTRDPGGTEIGDRIRHILLDYDLSKMDIRCEAFLFMASRAQLVTEVVRPALERGDVVLGDRYVSATCCYQAAAGYDPQKVLQLAEMAIEGCWPALTLIIDMTVGEAFARTGRGGTGQHGGRRPVTSEGQPLLFSDAQIDAMEARPRNFHEEVRERFLKLDDIYPAPVRIVDGAGTVEEVHGRIMEAVVDAGI